MMYLEYLSGYFYDKICGALEYYKQSEIKSKNKTADEIKCIHGETCT